MGEKGGLERKREGGRKKERKGKKRGWRGGA